MRRLQWRSWGSSAATVVVVALEQWRREQRPTPQTHFLNRKKQEVYPLNEATILER